MNICLNNWDNNNDGELSYDEAANAPTIGLIFSGNKNIQNFNELQYFTGITTIDDKAFYGCDNLRTIIIPQNVKTIGYRAFYCLNNEPYGFPSSLASISLPEGLISIGQGAFQYCDFLKSITIPANVTLIGPYGLSFKAENIYFKSTNPPTISDENSEGGRVGTSVGVTSTKVYVPRNSVEQYKAITHLNTREIIGYDFE